MLEGIIELNQFEADDQVTKMNKLKGITEITFNLDELYNSINLKDGRPSNSLLTYYVTDDKDFEPQNPQVHIQNFGGVASRVPWGWHDSFGKMGNLAGWVTKVCLKCTESWGREGG